MQFFKQLSLCITIITQKILSFCSQFHFLRVSTSVHIFFQNEVISGVSCIGINQKLNTFGFRSRTQIQCLKDVNSWWLFDRHLFLTCRSYIRPLPPLQIDTDILKKCTQNVFLLTSLFKTMESSNKITYSLLRNTTMWNAFLCCIQDSRHAIRHKIYLRLTLTRTPLPIFVFYQPAINTDSLFSWPSNINIDDVLPQVSSVELPRSICWGENR